MVELKSTVNQADPQLNSNNNNEETNEKESNYDEGNVIHHIY